MKRLMIALLALAMLATGWAMAETPVQMKIINCQEWVSLRAEADGNAQRFAEVPLGTTVRGYYASNGEFSQCEYDGIVGYILNQYLEVMAADEGEESATAGAPAQEIELNGGTLRIWKERTAEKEEMQLEFVDAEGKTVWSHREETLSTTELESLEVFINDKAEETMVMVYNSYYGLTALNAESGETIWTLTVSEISLGGSIKTAVGEDGTMYIGGYYGPDPAAISAEGKVLYSCSSLHEEEYGEDTFFWMTGIDVLESGIAVHYDNCDAPTKAIFDESGNMISYEAE